MNFKWVFLISYLHFATSERPGFAPIFQWSQLEFDYQTPQDRKNDINDGFFIPGIPAPIDVDVYYNSKDNSRDNRHKVFVTIPKFQKGIPASLGTVSDQKVNGNPVIKPYPDWSWHRNRTYCDANRIISVYRVQIDECGRLWVLDTGHFLEEQVCRPQILAFDLSTNQLIHRYEIPDDQIEPRSLLVTLKVDIKDTSGKCKDTFVYMADCQAFALIVHDVRSRTSWKVSDKSFYPYPNYGTYDILGDRFELMDGILGMSLSPQNSRGGQDRRLFYHAMSSPTENWVYTSQLQNHSRFANNPASSPEIFNTYTGQRRTQSAAEDIDKNGIMYFGLHSDVTIDCWNTRTEYGPRNFDIISNNKETSQFASGVKVITNKANVQELWIMTSRFQKVATGTLRTSEINFRIQAGKVEDLVFGTKCRNQNHPNSGGGGGGGFGGGGGGGGYGLLKNQGQVQASASANNNY